MVGVCHLPLAFASSHVAVWVEMGLVFVLVGAVCSSSLITMGLS